MRGLKTMGILLGADSNNQYMIIDYKINISGYRWNFTLEDEIHAFLFTTNIWEQVKNFTIVKRITV